MFTEIVMNHDFFNIFQNYNVLWLKTVKTGTHIAFDITILVLGIYFKGVFRKMHKYTYWNIINNSRKKQFKCSSDYVVEIINT